MMITVEHIRALLEKHLAGKETFLVEVKVNAGNAIRVHVDTPAGISIDECVAISRYLNGELDRDVEAAGGDPDAGLEVERLLETLDPRDRFVLLLLDGEGWSVAEIARRVGWSESNVKVRAHRARKKLRRLLEKGLGVFVRSHSPPGRSVSGTAVKLPELGPYLPSWVPPSPSVRQGEFGNRV